jgi:Cu(I)/Ag(I) efflux system membrane protein CusA/SilA
MRMLFARMEPVKIRWPWARRASPVLSKIATALAVGTYYPEEKHPVSRVLFRIYEPACRFVLKHRKTTIITALALVLTTIPIYLRLGSEFMPPLHEGAILYMPTTLPGLSVSEAGRILQKQDKILKSFPEVQSVFGKIGRADTSTDPAPFSMVETTVILKPVAYQKTLVLIFTGIHPQIFSFHLEGSYQLRRVDR